MLDTLVVTLLLTLPSVRAETVWIPPSERDTPSDSMAATCGPSASLLWDLDSLIFYGYPTSGGGFRRVFAKSVRGREGQLDSTTLHLPGWQGGNFYITTKRIGAGAKESCASNRVFFGTVTAVEPPKRLRVVVEEWFDVAGRRLKGPTGTGIRYVRWTVNGRFIGQQRVVVLRGRPLSPIRRPNP